MIPNSSPQLSAVYRRASAIARLAWIGQFGTVRLGHDEGREVVEVHFHNQGPMCKCCGKPMPRKEWIAFIMGKYVDEIKAQLRDEGAVQRER